MRGGPLAARPVPLAAAAVEAAMARYDSPGYHNLMPGIPDRDESMTAPGSPAPYPVPDITGTTPTSALVTPYGSGYQNADRVAVAPDMTQVPAQTDLYAGQDANPLSGVLGDQAGHTGAGTGAVHDPHPNSTARRPS